MSFNNKKENPFKSKNLKQNNRWKNFENSVVKEQKNAFQSSNRFSQKSNSFNRSKGKTSKFGRRIYRSKHNKEDTLNYFQNEKNSTIRSLSLFECLTKPEKIDKIVKENKQNVVEKKTNEVFEKDTMTQSDKSYILNQYMYEEDSDDNDEQDDIIDKKNTTTFIEF